MGDTNVPIYERTLLKGKMSPLAKIITAVEPRFQLPR